MWINRATNKVGLLGALFFVFSFSLVAGAEQVPWMRPSSMSNYAVGSFMMAVTTAGKRMVAVGEHGHVLLSDDRGDSWRQVAVPVSCTLTAVQFVNPRTGWIVGHNGVVLKTVDGGETWSKQLDGVAAAQIVVETATNHDQAQRLVDDGPDKPFLDLYFEDENRGFIVGAYNFIFHTEDGGESWHPWLEHTENPRELHLNAIQRIGDNYYIAGEQGLLLRSSDGGETFHVLATPYEGSYFGVVGSSTENLMIFGLRGNVYHSGDGGKSWKRVESGVDNSLISGLVLKDGRVLLVSSGGEVLVKCKDQDSFQNVSINERFPLTDILQLPDGSFMLTGSRGTTRLPDPVCDKDIPVARTGVKSQ